jgi:DNA-binding CsgD family transcriptional regulator
MSTTWETRQCGTCPTLDLDLLWASGKEMALCVPLFLEHRVSVRCSFRDRLNHIPVLKLVATGTSNKIIAEQLSLAETTVKTHVQNILFKLGANDRTHAVTIALKRGYIELG